MRFKVLFISAAAAVILLFGMAAGESDQFRPDAFAGEEQPQITGTLESTLKYLPHAIDLWHDANLKGDGGLAMKRQTYLLALLRADMKRNAEAFDRYRMELAAAESPGHELSTLQRQELLASLNAADQWFKVKRRLIGAITKSNAFSNKFRLMGDYCELLRREMDQSRTRVAATEESEIDDSGETEK